MNAHLSRHDPEKLLPSGCTPNEAYNNPGKWGGRDCLIPVEVKVIDEMITELGGEDLLEFVSQVLAKKYEEVYEEIGSPTLSLRTGWTIFSTMLPLVV